MNIETVMSSSRKLLFYGTLKKLENTYEQCFLNLVKARAANHRSKIYTAKIDLDEAKFALILFMQEKDIDSDILYLTPREIAYYKIR